MNFGGDPDKLLDMARNGDIVLAISDPIVEEVTHVLRDKFGWNDEAIKLAQARIADFTEKVHPRRAIDVVKEDPSDNRILELCRGWRVCVYRPGRCTSLEARTVRWHEDPQACGIPWAAIVTCSRALSAKPVSLSLICGHGIPCRHLRGVVAVLLGFAAELYEGGGGFLHKRIHANARRSPGRVRARPFERSNP